MAAMSDERDAMEDILVLHRRIVLLLKLIFIHEGADLNPQKS